MESACITIALCNKDSNWRIFKEPPISQTIQITDYDRNRAVKTERKRSLRPRSHTDCSTVHRVSEMEETVRVLQRDSTEIVG